MTESTVEAEEFSPGDRVTFLCKRREESLDGALVYRARNCEYFLRSCRDLCVGMFTQGISLDGIQRGCLENLLLQGFDHDD